MMLTPCAFIFIARVTGAVALVAMRAALRGKLRMLLMNSLAGHRATVAPNAQLMLLSHAGVSAGDEERGALALRGDHQSNPKPTLVLFHLYGNYNFT